MKKLVLHSDQVNDKSQVDEAFLKKFFNNRKPKIAYIPSQSDLQRIYFNQKVEWYKQFGITDFLYFDIDQEYHEDKIPELLACDVIFLSGGNTYYFLNSLKKRNFIPLLKGFVENGGVLVGVSAGSILMSESIAMSSIGNDQNTVGITDLSSLGLNNFEFFPHFDKNNNEVLDKLMEYSKKNNTIIYACKDGDGIIVADNDVQFIGEVLKITNGHI